MGYRSRTEQRQLFRPTVVLLSNSILPCWYVEKAHAVISPDFQLYRENVEVEIDRSYSAIKKLIHGPYNCIFWIIEIEPLLVVEQNKGRTRDEVISLMQQILDELCLFPQLKVIINNPSYELWLQLHFERLSVAFETTCVNVYDAIRRYLPDYSRETTYYNEEKNIFHKTKDRIEFAEMNANSLCHPDFPDLKYARTMMSDVVHFLKAPSV